MISKSIYFRANFSNLSKISSSHLSKPFCSKKRGWQWNSFLFYNYETALKRQDKAYRIYGGVKQILTSTWLRPRFIAIPKPSASLHRQRNHPVATRDFIPVTITNSRVCCVGRVRKVVLRNNSTPTDGTTIVSFSLSLVSGTEQVLGLTWHSRSLKHSYLVRVFIASSASLTSGCEYSLHLLVRDSRIVTTCSNAEQ